MCNGCVKEGFLDRGKTCLEKGTYLLNYNQCVQCQKKSLLEEKDVRMEEEDNEETIAFKHVCQDCGHVIATHKYSFSFDEDFQEYTMECALCGHGSDTVSILPDDDFLNQEDHN